MKISRALLALAAGAGLTLATSAAFADEAKTPAANAGDTLSDMKVTRDKDTGRLRPTTPEENAAIKASGRSVAPSVLVVRRPVSTIERRSDGSTVGKRSLADMDNLTMTRKADGSVVLNHGEQAAPVAPVK